MDQNSQRPSTESPQEYSREKSCRPLESKLKTAEALGTFRLCPDQDTTSLLRKNPLNNQEEEFPELIQSENVMCSQYLDRRQLGHREDWQKGVASVVGRFSPELKVPWVPLCSARVQNVKRPKHSQKV